MTTKIQNKALHRSAYALYLKMVNMHLRWEKGIGTLQFQAQTEETKRHFYKAIDEVKRFIDNIY